MIQETCEEVEGCGNSNLLSNTFGLRSKRHITIEEIRAALAANPDLQRQIRLMNRFGTQSQTTSGTTLIFSTYINNNFPIYDFTILIFYTFVWKLLIFLRLKMNCYFETV